MKNTIGYMRLRIASISKLAAATTLSLGLIACGGEREQQAPQDNEARVTVQGADGASVSYARSTGDHAKITVRVARDASGAQPLPQDLKPLSSIYQFTPLGMAATDIEIRLPFSASATDRGAPSLWVTVPGEGWTQLLDARVEGSWMVARAPRMAHAVVATSPLQSSSFKPSSPSATLASIHHILAKESFTATTTGPGQLGAPWMWAASPGGTLTVLRAFASAFDLAVVVPTPTGLKAMWTTAASATKPCSSVARNWIPALPSIARSTRARPRVRRRPHQPARNPSLPRSSGRAARELGNGPPIRAARCPSPVCARRFAMAVVVQRPTGLRAMWITVASATTPCSSAVRNWILVPPSIARLTRAPPHRSHPLRPPAHNPSLAR